MEKFIDRTKKIIFAEQGGIVSSAIILSFMIVVSRVFGFMRYRILAGYFSKNELDIFFASFRIPDLVFEILITGALTSSFIPVFIRYQKSREELDENISSIFNLLSLCLFVIVIALFFGMDWIVPAITPGFSGDKIRDIVMYSKVLLLGQLPFLVVGNFLTGIAQAKKTFFITALAPVIYNVAVIIFTYFFAPQMHLFAPIWGTVIGSALFFVIQFPVMFLYGFSYRPLVKITTGVKDFFRMVVPRILTVIITQIDATIDLTLTTLMGAGAYTEFYFAQHLQLLPVSVIGIAFGQASLPYLSEMFEAKREDAFRKVIVDSVLNLFFFTIPIMGFFIVARTPMVRLFFGGEKFDWDATVQTAFALSYFSLSLPFHAIYYFLTRCFYAIHDSRTPFVFSLLSIVVNTVMSLVFVLVLKLPIWSLALSFSAAIVFNSVALFFLLSRRLGGLDLKTITRETLKITLAMLVAAPATYLFIKVSDNLIFDTTRTINVFFLLAGGCALYFLVYLLMSWFLGTKELYLITSLMVKAKEYRNKFVEMTSSHE